MYIITYYYTMEFTSATEIARKWTKILSEQDEVVILKNNAFLWLYLWWTLGKTILESWIIQQIREELWEMQDRETSALVEDYRNNWLGDESQDFSDFLREYDV